MANSKSVFETLSAINVNDKVEKKSNLSYLSWAWAWAEVKKNYPDATYNVLRDPLTQSPYFYDQTLGYMVMTSVTISGETLEMWLPVMDGANKSMKSESYEYATKYGTKTVDAATMFDINKALMRCLTKNLAMFGLGHYIYAGEDLPESEEEVKSVIKPQPKQNPAPASADKKPLKVGDDNWQKIYKWVEENKHLGFEVIKGTIDNKYKVTATIEKELKKAIDQ